MSDTAKIALMLAGTGVVSMYFVSAALGFFVALNARPARRAAWNVGIPYLLASAGTTYLLAVTIPDSFGEPSPIDPWLAPLLMAPGALIAFLLRLWVYRSTWVESIDDLAEGESLANDDWRVGIFQLLIFVGFLLALGIWRFLVKSGIASL